MYFKTERSAGILRMTQNDHLGALKGRELAPAGRKHREQKGKASPVSPTVSSLPPLIKFLHNHVIANVFCHLSLKINMCIVLYDLQSILRECL